ncbi:polyphosphate polymerase domain-containing protein [Maribellus maritimus]|uniref:polyphosphate polymerase domain-containing protein n=1 Tax=Maribellus maritimus TaxID=2870838 RepID=UPI001EEAC35B|nr:polyphosphate polymerase domain-containing protein [Maribellus maritimus]MCG6186017.1 polyphosphate polymerase domain-containing protein [Maribellus maritimus]
MNRIVNILAKFEPVLLGETTEIKLMNRIDRKYWFTLAQLPGLLEKAFPFYRILEIEGQRLMEYHTTYFDTEKNEMYLTHHNQKLNRYKIRRRNYVNSNTGFFEVKLKNNKCRTIKERIATDFENSEISRTEDNFLETSSPFGNKNLQPALKNRFYRITLVHKQKTDRCTIDLKPKFWNTKSEIQFDDLVIFELKRGSSLKSSPMVLLLREMKIRQRGLSKYCTGRAVLEPSLKQNAFKPRLRFLQKLKENNPTENEDTANSWN